jgi:xylulokinase
VTLLLGIDVGTTSIKAVVYQTDGTAVASAALPTPTHVPRPRWAYYRADELWQTAVDVTRRALMGIAHPGQIVSVAVASVAESGVLLDAAGRATTDSIAWFDTRTRPQAEWLAERIAPDDLFERTGLSLQPIFSLNKLLWYREHEPEAWTRSVRWLLLADYIAFRLSGVGATDLSLASRTLMLNLREKRWDEVTLAQTGIDPGLLAPLVPGGSALGRVTRTASDETRLPTSAVVSSGGHDHVCGALAAGVTAPGQMLNSLGTAEAVFLPTSEPLTDPKAGRQGYSQGAHVAGGGYYVFAGQYTSGASIDWLRHLLGSGGDLLAYDAMIGGARKVSAGSLGVMFLPHLRLANPPYDDARSRGALLGLTTESGSEVVTRAVFEGLAFETRGTLEPLLEYPQVVAPQSVVAIGGGTKNSLLMQIKASVTNLPHQIVDAEEATALGAALLGGLGADVFKSVEEARGAMRYEQHTVHPQPEDVSLYESIYRGIYSRIYPTVAPLSQSISDLQATTVVSDEESDSPCE